MAQFRLPLLLPERRSLQFFVSFRMSDDVPAAWRECPERLPPPGDNSARVQKVRWPSPGFYPCDLSSGSWRNQKTRRRRAEKTRSRGSSE